MAVMGSDRLQGVSAAMQHAFSGGASTHSHGMRPDLEDNGDGIADTSMQDGPQDAMLGRRGHLLREGAVSVLSVERLGQEARQARPIPIGVDLHSVHSCHATCPSKKLALL